MKLFWGPDTFLRLLTASMCPKSLTNVSSHPSGLQHPRINSITCVVSSLRKTSESRRIPETVFTLTSFPPASGNTKTFFGGEICGEIENRGDHRQLEGFRTAKVSGRSLRDRTLSNKEQDPETHTHTLKVQCLQAKVIWPDTKLLSQPRVLTRSQTRNNRKSLETAEDSSSQTIPFFISVCMCDVSARLSVGVAAL